MLRISTTVAIPAVVRNIDKDPRAIGREAADLVWKNRFVADEDTQFLVSRWQRRPDYALRKISNFLGQTASESKQSLERHIFAERHQIDLCVARHPFTGRI